MPIVRKAKKKDPWYKKPVPPALLGLSFLPLGLLTRNQAYSAASAIAHEMNDIQVQARATQAGSTKEYIHKLLHAAGKDPRDFYIYDKGSSLSDMLGSMAIPEAYPRIQKLVDKYPALKNELKGVRFDKPSIHADLSASVETLAHEVGHLAPKGFPGLLLSRLGTLGKLTLTPASYGLLGAAALYHPEGDDTPNYKLLTGALGTKALGSLLVQAEEARANSRGRELLSSLKKDTTAFNRLARLNQGNYAFAQLGNAMPLVLMAIGVGIAQKARQRDKELMEKKGGQEVLVKRYKLVKLEKRTPDSQVNSIGFSNANQQWYGWSHRAVSGFPIGHVVKRGDVVAEEKPSLVGFKVRSLADSKRLAKVFAEGVA